MRQHVWNLALADARRPNPLPDLLRRDDFDDAVSVLRDLGEDGDRTDVQRRVNRIADQIHYELALHVDMATEALELLPPANGPVWWGGWLPGPADTHPDSPLLHDGTLFLTRFRSATERHHEAIEYAVDADVEGEEDCHPALGHLPHSTAPMIAPFSAWPLEKEVLYPPGRALAVVAHEIRDDSDALEQYSALTLAELPPIRPAPTTTSITIRLFRPAPPIAPFTGRCSVPTKAMSSSTAPGSTCGRSTRRPAAPPRPFCSPLSATVPRCPTRSRQPSPHALPPSGNGLRIASTTITSAARSFSHWTALPWCLYRC